MPRPLSFKDRLRLGRPCLSLVLWRRLALLQLLLLLNVFLRQLLRLLLVLLLYLLSFCVVSFLLSQLLVVLVLLLLQSLAFLVLLRLQLLLLLLVFLVRFRVPRVWRSGAFASRKVIGMHGRVGASSVVLWTRSRFMNRSALSGRYDSATFQFSGSASRRDWRLAVVCGSAQLRV